MIQEFENTLLVSGCSITHGSELCHMFYHPDNIKSSYPALVAQSLGIDLVNLALPGAGNEYVFDSLVQYLRSHRPRSVIAAWTFTDRFYWKYHGRHWLFNASWASTFIDLNQPGIHEHHNHGVVFVADEPNLIPVLEQQHRILVDHYFNNGYLTHQLLNYSHSLRAICKEQGIDLVEIDAAQNYNLNIKRLENLELNYIAQGRHPNQQEHKIIADFILKNFYQKDNNGQEIKS